MRSLTLAIAALGLAGCGAKATLPPVRQAADATSRHALYESYKLSQGTGRWERWTRRDGSYSFRQLEDVIDVYPESRATGQDVRKRRLVIGAVGGTAVGVVAFTFVYNFAVPAESRMSPSTQSAIYIGGGALALAGILMQIAWRDPAVDLADIYDRALANDLGITPPGRGPGAPLGTRTPSPPPRLVLAPAPVVGTRGTVLPGVGAGVVF